MDARLSPERIGELIGTGEPVDLLVRQVDGPAMARDRATLLELDGKTLRYRTQFGVVEQALVDDVLDADLVRRRLGGGDGPLAKILDVLSLWP